jgi:hypothetical protein
VYEKHSKAIGAFDDTDYMVYLMSQTPHAEVRDRLLLLLGALSVHPMNCEKMINPDCMELLVDLLTTAHTTVSKPCRTITSVARVRIIVVSDRGQITYGKTCLDNVETANRGVAVGFRLTGVRLSTAKAQHVSWAR